MEINKIFFVGLGGAGQRHLRIFKELLPGGVEFSAFRKTKKTPLLNSDFSVNQDSSLEEKFKLKLFNCLDDGLNNNPDLIIISNPTSCHYEVAQKAAEKGVNIFIEKPFSHNLKGFSEFKNIVLKKDLYFFISFQRRFHPYLKKIKDVIESSKLGKVISATFNVCSYVPAWHPYENFRDLYACRNDLGGGVLLTEIHEIDLCYWYFGLPDCVYCAGGNYSQVKLDVEDTAHITLKYKDFVVSINLSFMQKHNRRDLYIAGEEGYIDWNAQTNQLMIGSYNNKDREVLSNLKHTNNDMFFSQASYFLNDFQHSDKSYLDSAEATVAIVEAAKKSMEKGTEVKFKNGRYSEKI